MRTSLRRQAAAVGCTLVAACSSPGPPDPVFEQAALTRRIPADLDIGFDPLEPRAAAREGDRVVAHVLAETGGGVVERYVTIELVGLLDFVDRRTIDVQHPTGATGDEGTPLPMHRWALDWNADAWVYHFEFAGVVDIVVYDGDGAELARRRVGNQLVAALTTNGHTETVAYSAGAGPLFDTVRSVPELEELLMDVAKHPPIWTLFGGLTLRLEWPRGGLRIIDDELFELPSRIDAEGYPALEGRVVHGPTASPYLLSAGVRRIEAVHPDRPERRAWIEIVGARRGAGPPLFQRPHGAFSAPDDDGLFTVDDGEIERILATATGRDEAR